MENDLVVLQKVYIKGIAEQHFVEINLGDVDTASGIDIIAQGWIRPTDTSINVASSQGSSPAPKRWKFLFQTVKVVGTLSFQTLAFPAGKLKTIVLEITTAEVLSVVTIRVRIATNLEIYWDRLAFGTSNDSAIQEIPIETSFG